ncbi:MAG: DUF2007 domain-containing protein [Chloroflexi bacterium]|nr:DUF2007 domain-containing protein [Chloroflexota bacterium]
MPFCPKCRYEFEDWAKACSDCGLDLVDELQPRRGRVASHDNPRLDNLVTIASFSHPEEAHVVSARLESEGIWSFVADEYTVTANWLYSNAIGGVKVKVRESDAASAAQVLFVKQEFPQASPGDSDVCPKCNSAAIHYETFHLRPVFICWLLALLVLGNGAFVIPILKRRWRCNSCGHEWRDGSRAGQPKTGASSQ